jgi:hypothetical protein
MSDSLKVQRQTHVQGEVEHPHGVQTSTVLHRSTQDRLHRMSCALGPRPLRGCLRSCRCCASTIAPMGAWPTRSRSAARSATTRSCLHQPCMTRVQLGCRAHRCTCVLRRNAGTRSDAAQRYGRRLAVLKEWGLQPSQKCPGCTWQLAGKRAAVQLAWKVYTPH